MTEEKCMKLFLKDLGVVLEKHCAVLTALDGGPEQLPTIEASFDDIYIEEKIGVTVRVKDLKE